MKRVVILGGGYGGLKALKVLEKEDVEVILIDKNSYHYLQTQSYDFLGLNSNLKEIMIPFNNLLRGKKFIQDEIISLEENILIGKEGRYEFDFLIIGVGSVTNRPKLFDNKNLFEVKRLKSALKLQESIEEIFLSSFEDKKSANIVVIGGGSSGVEIVSQIQYLLNEYNIKSIRTHIISDKFLEELDQKSKKEALEVLKKLGVNIVEGLVKKVEDSYIVLNNKKIDFDFGVLTIGISPSEFIDKLPFEKESGFLVVDSYLRVKENIFAIGDCAVIKDKDGKTLPPTAQVAEQSGVFAAKNIINLIKGDKLQKADVKIYGLAVSLGGKMGVAVSPFIKVEGVLAYLGKKAIEKFYRLTLKV